MKKDRGQIYWKRLEKSKIVRIYIDTKGDGRISTVIHEILHFIFNDLPVNAELEEAAILAWEKVLYNFILNSPQRRTAWRKTIEDKLNGK